MTEILPCPFCGAPASTIYMAVTGGRFKGTATFGIACYGTDDECAVKPCVYEESLEEAIDTWNVRTRKPNPLPSALPDGG